MNYAYTWIGRVAHVMELMLVVVCYYCYIFLFCRLGSLFKSFLSESVITVQVGSQSTDLRGLTVL